MSGWPKRTARGPLTEPYCMPPNAVGDWLPEDHLARVRPGDWRWPDAVELHRRRTSSGWRPKLRGLAGPGGGPSTWRTLASGRLSPRPTSPASPSRREDRLARIRAAKAVLEADARETRTAQLREQAERARTLAASSDDPAERERGAERREAAAHALVADGDGDDPSGSERAENARWARGARRGRVHLDPAPAWGAAHRTGRAARTRGDAPAADTPQGQQPCGSGRLPKAEVPPGTRVPARSSRRWGSGGSRCADWRRREVSGDWFACTPICCGSMRRGSQGGGLSRADGARPNPGSRAGIGTAASRPAQAPPRSGRAGRGRAGARTPHRLSSPDWAASRAAIRPCGASAAARHRAPSGVAHARSVLRTGLRPPAGRPDAGLTRSARSNVLRRRSCLRSPTESRLRLPGALAPNRLYGRGRPAGSSGTHRPARRAVVGFGARRQRLRQRRGRLSLPHGGRGAQPARAVSRVGAGHRATSYVVPWLTKAVRTRSNRSATCPALPAVWPLARHPRR
jgi:hypothetical protein